MNSEKEVYIQVPSLLVMELEGKFKDQTISINRKYLKAKENILLLASLMSTKGYDNWCQGKHPRVSLSSSMLQQASGHNYNRILEFLEKENIIVINTSYQPRQFCKHFWLTNEYLEGGMEEYEITDRFVKNRYLKMIGNRVRNGTD